MFTTRDLKSTTDNSNRLARVNGILETNAENGTGKRF